jgi:iron complex transport system ATP-binding protein
MARAIAQDTPVLFLDEPTSALDFQNQMRIWEIMREIAEEGKTILACSHDPNHVAWFCDRVVVVGEGAVVAEGHPEDVISEGVLGEIYQDVCSVRTLDGVQMVMPRCVVERNGKPGGGLPLHDTPLVRTWSEVDART